MLVFLLLMNASGFAIMLLDKNLARCHRRRIPEALLLAFAACFGSLGVLAGMYLCRHKTRKRSLRSQSRCCFWRSARFYISCFADYWRSLRLLPLLSTI